MKILTITLIALASLSIALPVAHPRNPAYTSGYAFPILFIPPPRSSFDHLPLLTQPTAVHYTVEKGHRRRRARLDHLARVRVRCLQAVRGASRARCASAEYGRPMSKYDLERIKKPPKNLILGMIEGATMYFKMKKKMDEKLKEGPGPEDGNGKMRRRKRGRKRRGKTRKILEMRVGMSKREGGGDL